MILWFVQPPFLEVRSLRPPSTVYMNPDYNKQIRKFPQRPGKLECGHFLRTGLCKFNSTCKFHHPKDWIATLPPCNLNDKGVPLRPVSYLFYSALFCLLGDCKKLKACSYFCYIV